MQRKANLMLEIFLAICLGSAMFCANAICMIVALKFMGYLSIDRYSRVSTLALPIGAFFIARSLGMHRAGIATLSILVILIVILNYVFTGYVYSTL